MWLSLVERTVRDGEVVGSNPVIPTIQKDTDFIQCVLKQVSFSFSILDFVSMHLTLMALEISLLHRRTSNLMKCACKYCG